MSAQARVPVSVVGSLALHAGALVAFAYLTSLNGKSSARVISNVDLFIQIRRPSSLARPVVQAAVPTTLDFLKMALPALPKAAPQRLEVKVPEVLRKPLKLEETKLEDRGKKAAAPKLEALDLSQKRVDMAKIEAPVAPRKVQALAALPRLEEVGRRKVRNLPQALVLEERRQEAVAIQRLEAFNPQTHKHLASAPELLKEAAAPGSPLASKLSKFLPAEDKIEFTPQMREAPEPIRKKFEPVISAAPAKREAQALGQERKSGVEIEGPLADRKVVFYHIPEFPDWAREQGVLEASVSIRFHVSADGSVLPGMRVEHTSGYGRLDRLAMDSLKRWRFVPEESQERQWGVITFRYILE